MPDCDTVIEVEIRDNIVCAIREIPRPAGAEVPATRLEVSRQLASRHLEHGCIDGSYRFDDAERARSFAVLALDFVKRLIERRIDEIESLDTGEGYDAGGEAKGSRQ